MYRTRNIYKNKMNETNNGAGVGGGGGGGGGDEENSSELLWHVPNVVFVQFS